MAQNNSYHIAFYFYIYLLILILYVWVPARMQMYRVDGWCPQRPEKGTQSPRTAVTDSCELLCGCWKRNRVFCKTRQFGYPLNHLLPHRPLYIIYLCKVMFSALTVIKIKMLISSEIPWRSCSVQYQIFSQDWVVCAKNKQIHLSH